MDWGVLINNLGEIGRVVVIFIYCFFSEFLCKLFKISEEFLVEYKSYYNFVGFICNFYVCVEVFCRFIENRVYLRYKFIFNNLLELNMLRS